MKNGLSGLQRLCKLYGRMKCGDTMMVWDYAANKALPESQMKIGSERWKSSERTKYSELQTQIRHKT